MWDNTSSSAARSSLGSVCRPDMKQKSREAKRRLRRRRGMSHHGGGLDTRHTGSELQSAKVTHFQVGHTLVFLRFWVSPRCMAWFCWWRFETLFQFHPQSLISVSSKANCNDYNRPFKVEPTKSSETSPSANLRHTPWINPKTIKHHSDDGESLKTRSHSV